jgi:hypothetical protein
MEKDNQEEKTGGCTMGYSRAAHRVVIWLINGEM